MRNTLLIITLAFSIKSSAQIEQVEIKTKPAAKLAIPPYDSLNRDYHIHGDLTKNEFSKLRELIGQELTVIPRSKKYTKYYNFNFDPNQAFFSRADLNGTRSNYNDYDGKKLRITDFVILNSSYDENEISRLVFELVDETTGSKLYWCFYWIGNISYPDIPRPLLMQGHYEKLKLKYVGKDFVSTSSSSNMFFDNNTGDSVDMQAGSMWKCIKMAYGDYTDDPYQKLTAVLVSDRGNEIVIEFANLTKYFISKEQQLKNIEEQKLKQEAEKAEEQRKAEASAKQEKLQKIANAKQTEDARKKSIANAERKKKRQEDLITKYGYNYGTAIANGKVIIGMTKEMCIAAWGKPINVNSTITANVTQEQWVYNMKTYLYFDKFGKLTAIQN
ncbi:cell envelope integrity protein TolA [Taibaiella soli]|uniref:Uncharacterized protein n=1 Tax=Taibaiella soli TaxID=1649169 RepID=A0A2W2BBJ2_9BACT|nr:cell envelope integrity protein TolA [Taibaiella soli]PZF73569.1 hypothetical protein DN068_07555 [Taibaiella soli]